MMLRWLALPGMVLVASAQTGGGVHVWSRADLLSAAKPDGKLSGATLNTFGSQSYGVFTRTASGQAELHRNRTDLLVIEDGSASLLFGGTMPDGKPTAAGEVRGSFIQNGQTRPVAQGDVIRIPAGTPHQFLLKPGQRVTYFAMKS